jgi:hypothetical protein
MPQSKNFEVLISLLCILGCAISFGYIFLRVQGYNSKVLEIFLLSFAGLGLLFIILIIGKHVLKFINEADELSDIFKIQKASNKSYRRKYYGKS